MTLYKWSRDPNTNGTSDSTCTWPEGMPPSQINDSARGNMAAIAKYRDDIAGAIVTAGTSTAYTVASYEAFDTLAHLNGQMIAFSPHVTNGATVTLNVDGLGAKPLRSAPNAELLPGTIIQGTPYVAVYNNTDGAFYLQGLYGNPYNIPLAASIDFWAPTAPNSSFAFPYGQSISRTTYAALFALIGTTYGAGLGDGLTFSLPDLRGRVVASPDNLGGGSDQNRLTSGALAAVRFSLGGVGGESGHTLTVSELPSHTHSGATGNENQSHSHGSIPVISSQMAAGGGYTFANGGFSYVSPGATGTSGTESQAHNHNFTTDAGTGGNQSHNVVQPTILANRIMRII